MPRIEKIAETDTTVTLRALVTPYGSPERRDFSGEFFHPGTDFGDGYGVKSKLGFYEHAINPTVNPHKPPDIRPVIGVATLVKTDDAGRWYDFELQRSDKYTPYVLALFGKGRLGASSQAYMGTKRMDPAVKGKIDMWIEAEPSLTLTPDNPDTIYTDEEIKSLMKSFAPDLYKATYEMTEDKKDEDVMDLGKELEALEKAAEAGDALAPEVELPALRAEVAQLRANLEAATKSVSDAQAIIAQVPVLTTAIEELKKNMASMVKVMKLSNAERMKALSDQQLAALNLPPAKKDYKPAVTPGTQIQKNYAPVWPEDAPGGN